MDLWGKAPPSHGGSVGSVGVRLKRPSNRPLAATFRWGSRDWPQDLNTLNLCFPVVGAFGTRRAAPLSWRQCGLGAELSRLGLVAVEGVGARRVLALARPWGRYPSSVLEPQHIKPVAARRPKRGVSKHVNVHTHACAYMYIQLYTCVPIHTRVYIHNNTSVYMRTLGGDPIWCHEPREACAEIGVADARGHSRWGLR